jgi:hypothetical protein
MCVYMHSRFVENHPIQILEDGPLISEVVLSQFPSGFSLNSNFKKLYLNIQTSKNYEISSVGFIIF